MPPTLIPAPHPPPPPPQEKEYLHPSPIPVPRPLAESCLVSNIPEGRNSRSRIPFYNNS